MKPLNVHLKLAPERKATLQYWDIFNGKVRAGHITIKLTTDETLGEHHDVDLHIAQRMRGKGIGSIALKQASVKSAQSSIYGKVKTSNVAARKAAQKAGYKVISPEGAEKLTLQWQPEVKSKTER